MNTGERPDPSATQAAGQPAEPSAPASAAGVAAAAGTLQPVAGGGCDVRAEAPDGVAPLLAGLAGALPGGNEATAPAGPGAILARARESLGWSIAEVARQLKLHPKQIEALEQDAFDRLRSPIYVRGFARNYARLVGADTPALMRALDERCPMPALVSSESLPDIGIGATLPSSDRPSRRYVRVAAGVLLAVGAVALVDRFWSPWTAREVPAPAPVVQPAELPAALVGEPASGAPAPEGTAPVPAPVTDAPSVTPAGAAAPAARTVRVAFERESWVEIRDAAGQVILSGVNRAGTEQVVKGFAPLSVVVGNASGVRIDYEARRVDLQPHTQVNVARLTLD